MILYIFYAVVVILIIGFLSAPNPTAIYGIYSQPNKWYFLKYRLFKIILWLRQRQNKKNATATKGSVGYGMRSKNSPEQMEEVQNLPKDQPKAVDAVYFNGGNAEGQFLVAATARRQNNVVQTVLYLRLPDIGLFEIPSKPDTKLEATDPNAYAAGGLKLELVEPMKTWKITYNGKLRHDTTKKLHGTKFSLTWTAFTPFFDFDTDLHLDTMADAIAREQWSRAFFDKLKRAHQTHYEQFGTIQGQADISDIGKVEINVKGVRDHSYGAVRDWRYFHRYAINYITLSDKTAFCVGTISMPMTLSRLTVGYVIHPDGYIEPLSSSEFELFHHGEEGDPPKQHSFKFVAGNKDYNLECTVLDAPVFYIGEGRDAKIHERLCMFNINGVQGWGISEYDYRNVPFSDKDA